MPYDTERKLQVSEDDLNKVVNLAIWCHDLATLSDGRSVVLKRYEGGEPADIQADCLNELDPDRLRQLAIRLIEENKSIIIYAGALRAILKFD